IYTMSITAHIILILEIRATESDIVGGREAKPHSRPYMVSIQFQGQHVCAHCKKGPCTVVLGAHDISKKEKSQQHIEVSKYYPHPEFKEFEYDIMLLELKKNATLNKYVKTIGLPKKNGKTPANIKCVVAGWGQTGDDLPPSNVLKEATEKIQFSNECIHIWGEHFKSDHMICTNFSRKSGGICQGDSGGPLICNTKPQGITAFTKENDCNNPKYPHVFTKVNFFIGWIKHTMKQ
uniref:Peptidase S1 domain-containing protein n=1 Tax=Amphilophus citrinellus TaxID=61819 RepID=A0A3Q0S234_AMPCI